jgi:chorismate mutase
MQELENLRAQIDDIDNQLLELLARRQDVVKMVGEFKSRHNIQVFDKAREDYLYEFHQKLSVKYNLSFAFIEDLFAMIMEHSRKTQRELK